MVTRTQRFGYAAFAVLVAAASVLGLAAPAQAHNYLVSSTPAAGETLTELPAEFSVTTNDLLLNIGKDGSGFALQVQDAKGLYYGDGCIAVDGPGITTDAALGAPGEYTVTWQVISTDGHTVSNEFNFTWQPSSADSKVSTGSKTAPDCNGTLSPNASAQPDATGQKPAVSDDALGTVLWIGGAVVAVGIAVVVTLLVTSRRKKS